MKYIVLLGDGMADYPIEELGGKTPLEAAKTKNMDRLVREGITGSVKTIPDGFPPGSDVANLSIFGYDPETYYTGRAPLEAANMGINLSETDIAFRCNLVSINGEGDNAVMDDFSAGHITTEESSELVKLLNDKISSEHIQFYAGVSYRHIMVWHRGTDAMTCTPPHDISGRLIKDFLPKGEGAEFISGIMRESQKVLHGHPAANRIWLWGQGKSSHLPKFKEQYGIDGGVISAVDLVKGVGRLAGLKVINVPGATGYLDTNYKGKVDYAIDELKRTNFVYLHVEAPDEAAHTGNLKDKMKAIEDFDSLVVGGIIDKIKQFVDYSILVMCDHPTPVKLMTHTADCVPFAISPEKNPDPSAQFNESLIKQGSTHFTRGHELMSFFINRKT